MTTLSLNSVLEKTLIFDPKLWPEVIFAFTMKDSCRWTNRHNISVDVFPFTYMKYHNQVSGLTSFVHRFYSLQFAVSFFWTSEQGFIVTETFVSAVKTLIANNLRGRLPSHSPCECGSRVYLFPKKDHSVITFGEIKFGIRKVHVTDRNAWSSQWLAPGASKFKNPAITTKRFFQSMNCHH